MTNRFVDRMNRTLLDECFRVKDLTICYMAPKTIQRDLDVFIAIYNQQRTHQDYRLQGRTPAKDLRKALRRQTPAGLRAPRQQTRSRAWHHARRDSLKPQARRPDYGWNY
jgi:hypothetical protein